MNVMRGGGDSPCASRKPVMVVIVMVMIVALLMDGVQCGDGVIINSKVSVKVTLEGIRRDQLIERYYGVDSSGASSLMTTYTGPLLSGSDYDGVHLSWSNITQVSATSISVSGSLRYLTDTDTPGGDLGSVDVAGADPINCANLCAKNSACRGWAFVNPGIQKPSGVCWLKSKMGPQKLDSCCSSGVNGPQATFTRTISLDANNPNMVYVSHTAETVSSFPFISFDDWYTFAGWPVDFAYSPHIKHQDTDITPHWQFKSPAVMVQSGPLFAALVPDMDTLTSKSLSNYPPNLDFRNDGSSDAAFSFTVTNTELTFHSLYSRKATPMDWSPSAPLSCTYFLILSAQENPLLGYQMVTEFLWARFGSPRLADSPSMQQGFKDSSLNLFDSWRTDTWVRFADQVYFEFNCGTEVCGAMNSYRSGPGKDGWFNSWFQQLRTAYGWYINGQRTNNVVQMQRARRVLTLALHAPTYNSTVGAFASIFYLAPDGSQDWYIGDAWAGLCRSLPTPPPNCENYYHSFDMAWTGYWLAKWNEIVNEPRILPMMKGLGDFLVKQQSKNGVIPSYYNGLTLEVAPQLSVINSETAGSGLFLAQLYKATHNKAYLQAAVSAADWMSSNVMITRMWYDFETFFSCSIKPIGFYDGFTRQWPENNLGKIQTAMMFLELWNITNNNQYLVEGVKALDYLVLTQQVVSHPLLTPNLLGGFTTQNTDSEWSDARQGYAAAVLLDYYRATGRLEYLERGVAALRSSWAVAPYENWAHVGSYNGFGALTGIHWCQGSALTSIEMTYVWLRDAYINAKLNHGVGVNGCTLKNLKLDFSSTPASVSLTIVSKFTWTYDLVIAIEGASKNVSVTVNSQPLGTFGSAAPSGLIYVRVPPRVIG